MWKKKLPRFVQGRPIRAADLNAIAAMAEQSASLQVGPGLNARSDGSGVNIMMSGTTTIDAQIIAGSGAGPYDWQQIFPASGGTWIPGPMSGGAAFNAAYNDLAVTPGTLPCNVVLRWSTAGEWRFSMGAT